MDRDRELIRLRLVSGPRIPTRRQPARAPSAPPDRFRQCDSCRADRRLRMAESTRLRPSCSNLRRTEREQFFLDSQPARCDKPPRSAAAAPRRLARGFLDAAADESGPRSKHLTIVYLAARAQWISAQDRLPPKVS